MKKLISGLFLFSFALHVYAYEGSPKEQVALFFSDIAAGKGADAIDKLYSSNPAIS